MLTHTYINFDKPIFKSMKFNLLEKLIGCYKTEFLKVVAPLCTSSVNIL